MDRLLEQLRKQQGSVLHPNYSAPFYSFEDTLHRLLPYHLYQGTANSSQDYQRGHWLYSPSLTDCFHPTCSVFVNTLVFCVQWMMNLRRSPVSCSKGPRPWWINTDTFYSQSPK